MDGPWKAPWSLRCPRTFVLPEVILAGGSGGHKMNTTFQQLRSVWNDWVCHWVCLFYLGNIKKDIKIYWIFSLLESNIFGWGGGFVGSLYNFQTHPGPFLKNKWPFLRWLSPSNAAAVFFSRCFSMNSGSLAFCYWKGFNTRQDIRDIPKDAKKNTGPRPMACWKIMQPPGWCRWSIHLEWSINDGLGLNYYTPRN